MTELLSYDEDVDLAFLTARVLEGDHKLGAISLP